MARSRTATATKAAAAGDGSTSQALATQGAKSAPMTAMPVRMPQQIVTGPPTPEEFDMMLKMADRVAMTEFVPEALRGKPAAVLACILKGREIGIAPMDSLSSIYMIKGRPSLAGELVLALIRRAGHFVNGEASNEKATITGKRADTGEEHTVTWSVADAEQATTTEWSNGTKVVKKLIEKDNWQSYRRQMLWWRAVSELRGHLFSDVARGIWVREVAEDLPAPDPNAPPTSTGASAGGAPPAAPSSSPPPPAAPPAEPVEMSAEEEQALRILNGSLPKEKAWTKSKVKERVANVGYMQVLGEMATDHFTVHGSSCPHFTYDMANKTIIVHGVPGTAAKVPPGASQATSSGPTPPAAASSPAPTERADPRDPSNGEEQEQLL